MSNLWYKVAENNEDSLETAEWEKDYQERGYNHHGWREWQQGNCLEYAHALIRENPSLRFGVMGWANEDSNGEKFDIASHYFAHDDKHAYDSAGKHPLPYKGIDPDKTNHADWSRTDQDPDEHELPDEDTINLARKHVREHGILDGKYQGKTAQIALK